MFVLSNARAVFVLPAIQKLCIKFLLTHWARVTHICVSKLTNIDSDNGLSPGRRQAVIWTNVGILLIGSLGTISSDIFIEIHIFSFKKMYLKCSLQNDGHFVSASMCELTSRSYEFLSLRMNVGECIQHPGGNILVTVSDSYYMTSL